MGKYKFDMSHESERLDMQLEDGVYRFEIVSMEEKVSKSGNDMFEVQLALDSDPSQGCKVYLVDQEGKRWFLKQLLKACGVTENEEGLYEFDTDELIGKLVQGRVANQKEEWIDREGNPQTTNRCKVVEFKW